MKPENRIQQLLAELTASDAQTRRIAASCLADWIKEWKLDTSLLIETAERLLMAALAEQHTLTRSIILNALADACESGLLPQMNWTGLAAIIDTLSLGCLEPAIVILGTSGQSQYSSTIDRFQDHSNSDIREMVQEYVQLLLKQK